MSDEEDTGDPTKNSRRHRLKGAVARTKTKLTKKNKETATTVDDFLAGGKGSSSTGRPSVSDSFSGASAGPPTLLLSHQGGADGLNPADSVPPPQPSPRRVVVPRIDVSNSQRFPEAHPLDQHSHDNSESSLLRPAYQGRSQSTSSPAKGRGRARGLSVQFTNRPPIVIGEGGDEAETPPIEVGRAKARARSVSPPRSANSPGRGSRIWNRSPLQHIHRPGTSSPKPAPQNAPRPQQPPAPPPLAPGVRDSGGVPLPGIKRVQTGMIGSTPSPMSESRQAAEKEFEMSMGISPATTNSPAASLVSTADSATLHAPKPIHPPVAVPNVKEIPILHELKREHGTKSLRNKFESREGDILREARRADSPVSSLYSDEEFSPPPGPPPGKQSPAQAISPPSHSSPVRQSPNTGHGPPPSLPPPRRPVKDGFAPPPGPPPGHHQGPPPGRRPADEVFAPPPGPPPGRRPPGEPMAHPARLPPGPPPQRLPSQRNPDDEYMGWVPDGVNQTQAPSFPGIDAAGKLAPVPGVDENHDAKPEKHKRRWFRRGS